MTSLFSLASARGATCPAIIGGEMPAFTKSLKSGQRVKDFLEAPAVEQILGLRLNQALIGEASTARTLNTAAKEIEEVFARSDGRLVRCRRCRSSRAGPAKATRARIAVDARK
jgi:hypothetical protein